MPRQRRRLHNIVRYEHNYFRGWRVEIKRRGKSRRRYFRDDPDRAASLARAIRWRDSMIDHLPPPRRFKTRWPKNKTGTIGVSRSVDTTRTGSRIPRYKAVWVDEQGRDRSRSFSVLKYGATRARQLAIQIRKRVLAEMLRPSADPGKNRRRRR